MLQLQHTCENSNGFQKFLWKRVEKKRLEHRRESIHYDKIMTMSRKISYLTEDRHSKDDRMLDMNTGRVIYVSHNKGVNMIFEK